MRDVEGNVWKGMVAGLAGGLVASWTMNQFQAAWTRIQEGSEKPHGAQSMQPAEGSQGNQQDAKEQDDATVKAAKIIPLKSWDTSYKRARRNLPELPYIMRLVLSPAD